MLKIIEKLKKKISQGINSEENTHQLAEQAPKKGCNQTSLSQEKYNKRIDNTNKRDFVSRIYRDTGFICDV